MTKTISSNYSPNASAAMDKIRQRKQAYLNRLDPSDMSAQLVLADLARFCRANASTFDPNPQIQARLDGRREVWLRIADHLEMTETELYDLFVRGVK